jgi:hypothetical protein
MVLQRDKPIMVWGWDAAGTEVTVTLGEAKATAKADDKDDVVTTAHHAYLAYGHQLQAVHHAEQAAI